MAFDDVLARDPKSEEEFRTIIKETFVLVEGALADYPAETREEALARVRSAATPSKTRQYPSFAIAESEKASTAGTTSSDWGEKSSERHAPNQYRPWAMSVCVGRPAGGASKPWTQGLYRTASPPNAGALTRLRNSTSSRKSGNSVRSIWPSVIALPDGEFGATGISALASASQIFANA